MEFIKEYLAEAIQVIQQLDCIQIEKCVAMLSTLRENNGRLFVLGVGGSAANASHAVNDFRKIVNIETYTPTDNVAELTARTNDDGWASVFSSWLKVSRLNANDMIFIFSVGGGNVEKNISANLVAALVYAKEVQAKIIGIVSRDGGYTARVADACIIIPVINAENITAHAEAFQAVVWHLIVSHPKLKVVATKWESVNAAVEKS
jgi:D-sedoheptulose 7-phosphate isomerase